jgi:hypothetical protein
MRKLLLLAFLIPNLTVSGCVIPGTDFRIPIISDLFGPPIEEFRHDVIVIQSLQAIPSYTIRSGQSLILRAYVQNLQKPESDPQRDVEIELYDDCGIFKTEGSTCTGGNFGGTTKCKIDKMYPQSTAIVDWRMTANDLKIKTPCNVGVLVRYTYTTYTTSSASFVNQEQLEDLVAQGKQFSEKGMIVVGEGPVKSYIEVPNQPIMVDTRGGANTGKGMMTFWVENKGGGELEKNTIEKENIEIGCARSGATGSDEVTGCDKCLDKIDEEGLKLIGKSSPKYSCEIEPVNKGLITQDKTYQLTSKIEYSYKFMKEFKLTVEPEIELG